MDLLPIVTPSVCIARKARGVGILTTPTEGSGLRTVEALNVSFEYVQKWGIDGHVAEDVHEHVHEQVPPLSHGLV